MYKTFTVIYIVLTSYSFLAAFLLFMRKSNQKATFYLGLINLMMSFMFLIAYLTVDRLSINPVLQLYIVIPMIFFMTPLCYLYAVRLSRTETKNDGYHFIPAITVTVYVFARWISRHPYPAVDIEDLFGLHYVTFDLYLLLQSGLLILGGYLLKMFLIIRSYNNDIKQVYSSIEKTNLRWLQIHLGIGMAGCFIFFITNIMQYFLPAELAPVLNRIEYAGQAFSIVFLLSIVYFTFIQQEVKDRGNAPAYSRQRLGEQKEREYVERILSYMEEHKPYLEPELTVQDLAAMLDIPAARLTMVLNIQLKKNFYQFINSYRVEYAAGLLKDPAMAHENILTIALEAGFNSKTSFNAYFKRIMNMTPRDYRTGGTE